ncbi:MAG: DUF983 domain-containing protein [Bacteroidota bacterium]|nr:DUF983 domain-containing protein [Bacteroidota bacterium]
MKTEENKLISMVKEKCPNCGKGDVFYKNLPFLSLPKMKEDCDVCNYHFDREPGYFLGAMYISYGLAVLEGIITFLICYFLFPKMETLYVVLTVCAVMFILSMRNYKWSRVFYMYIFPN